MTHKEIGCINLKLSKKKQDYKVMNKIKISTNRNFGLVFFIVFLIVSIWPLINGEPVRIWSSIISLIFLILGLMNSKILTPLNKLWFKFGMILGAIVAPIVMGIVFFFNNNSNRSLYENNR